MAGGDQGRGAVTPLTRDAARALLSQAETGRRVAVAPVIQSGERLGAPPGFGSQPLDAHLPGGQVLANLLHPNFNVFEKLNRVLPDDSWYDPSVGPSRPIQFEILGFKIPEQMHLWIYDYEFSVFRLSGIEAGDIVEAEPGRFSGVMGFDLTINGKRPGNLQYQLDPQPVSLTKASMNTQGTPSGPTPTNDQFVATAFTSFASTASPGQSLLPVRRPVQGPEGQPWTVVAKQGEAVSLVCVIFKRVLSPIATIQARIAGYLIQSNESEALLQRMRPR